MNTLDHLKKGSGLTKAERAVADYIYQNRAAIHSLTLSKIARETYTSNATVIRLCQKLGHSGYRKFQLSLISELASRDVAGHDDPLAVSLDWQEEAAAIQTQLLDSLEAFLERRRSAEISGKIASAAKWICAAEDLAIYAAGDAFPALAPFVRDLARHGVHATLPQLLYGEAHTADVALIISAGSSFPRRETELLRQNGCRIIEISDSSAAIGADLPIYMVSAQESICGNSIAQKTELSYLLGCISALVVKAKQSE